MSNEHSYDKIKIPERLYFRIGDVAELLDVKPYVLRYWESEFPMIHPQKSSSGQRVYRRSDVEVALMIKHLLYEEKYSIVGARKRLRELRKEKDSDEKSQPNQSFSPDFKEDFFDLTHKIQNLIKSPIQKLFYY